MSINRHDKDGDAGYDEKQCKVARYHNGKQSIELFNEAMNQGKVKSAVSKEPQEIKRQWEAQSHISKSRRILIIDISVSISNDGVGTSMPVRNTSRTPDRNTSGMTERNEYRDNVHRCTDPTKNQLRAASLPPRNVSGSIPSFLHYNL